MKNISNEDLQSKVLDVIGMLRPHELLPSNPNWLARLQDLLEEIELPAEVFVAASNHPVEDSHFAYPSFRLTSNRLRLISVSSERRVAPDTLLTLVQLAMRMYKEQLQSAQLS
jgi:hypothetical protein